MANRLRLARHPVTAYSSPAAAPDAELHRRLQALIRRYLPPISATLLAEPQRSRDGLYIEWYTELAGQPVPLTALPPAEQERARALLQDRLAAIRRLVRGAVLAEADTPLATALLQATTYPAEETVYVVGAQPVLTFWGYGTLPVEPPPAPSISAPVEIHRRSPRRWIPWLLGVPVLAALVWGGLRFVPWRWPPRGPDYAALLAAAQNEEATLRRQLSGAQADLARALGRCAREARLAASREEERFLTERIRDLEAALRDRLRGCREQQALAAARAETERLEQALAALRSTLVERLKACPVQTAAKPEKPPPVKKSDAAKPKAKRREPKDDHPAAESPAAEAKERKPPARTPAEAQQAKREQGLPPCPGERPPEEAPDVGIVLDASGSMRLPERMTLGQQSQYAACQQQIPNPLFAIMQQLACYSLFEGASGPTRLEAAQRSMNNLVPSLPVDVDIGLAVLEDCPQASDYGSFSGAQRGQLLQGVSRLTPRRGTPLAHGLWLAGQKLDGVRAPAVMVVVSDGEDSCHQDPCAVARQLKAQKPTLKINVVDITGEGAANCLAQSTGGRVLSSSSGMPLEQMIREAAREAQKPAHCK